jgi:hypothetical protein
MDKGQKPSNPSDIHPCTEWDSNSRSLLQKTAEALPHADSRIGCHLYWEEKYEVINEYKVDRIANGTKISRNPDDG